MSDQFKIGDVVQLKSGGPKMTVTAVGDDYFTKQPFVSCVWFSDTKPPQREEGSFPPDALQHVAT